MNLIERAISLVAPYECLGCHDEGTIICSGCLLSAIPPLPSRCYRCHKATTQYAVCASCKKYSSLTHVWITTVYDSLAKELIYKLKFARAKTAAVPMAALMSAQLPVLDKNTIITHIPTANVRVRQRGYDQSAVIAKELAKINGWLYVPLLVRIGSSRQVGSTKTTRHQQLADSLIVHNINFIRGARILLVDDVVTTGATIETASQVLKKYKPKQIDVITFAQA